VNAGILHAPLIPRILIMIDDVLDVRLPVQRDSFLLTRLSANSRGWAKYTSPQRSNRSNPAGRTPLPERATKAKAAKAAKATRGRRGNKPATRSHHPSFNYASKRGAIDSCRNDRTLDFAATIHCGDVTSNQISRALRRSQVS
jgi:hypothetical protein